MPAIADSIRSVLKFCCIASVPLLAACGDDGDGGRGLGVASACSAPQTVFTPPAPAPGPPPAGMTLTLQQIGTFNRPLFVTAPPGDPTRLFVVEQGGTIQIINRNTGAPIGTFLDISGEVVNSDFENGLHGLAFDPNYNGTTNRRFYVSYTDADSNIVLARYLVSGNPNVAVSTVNRILMTTPTRGQHFAGMLAFNRNDGFLYISRGDGGSADPDDPAAADPDNNAQNLGTVLGKILRIDVSGGGDYAIPPDNPCVGRGRGEIWSMGLRNPWRFSFDRATGDLYIADVGEGRFEEVNVATVPSGAGRGANYGWKIMEGKHCSFPTSGCNPGNITQPTLEYTHVGQGCSGSITGGYVYRGTNPALAQLRGTYFYGDFCRGFVRSFRFNGQVELHFEWDSLALGPNSITSFGEDNQGELYITTTGGGLFRIVQ